MKKKKRIKSNVLMALLGVLIMILPFIDVFNNKIITLLYYILQFIIINILYKRIISSNF